MKENYNIVLDLNEEWNIENPQFVKECFDAGINVITNGDDIGNYLYIIASHNRTSNLGIPKIEVNNEVMKYYVLGNTVNNRTNIYYIDNVQVLASEEVNGTVYDIVGLLKGEKQNYWLDIHYGLGTSEDKNGNAILTRNSIYRLLGTRSAEYEVTQNGTYVFKIEDLSGNIEEVRVEVTEI